MKRSKNMALANATAALAILLGCCGPAQAAPKPQPRTVVVVVDTSPTADSVVWENYARLVGKLYEIQQTGDELVVVTSDAGGAKPKFELTRQKQDQARLVEQLWASKVSPAADRKPDHLAGLNRAESQVRHQEIVHPRGRCAVVLLMNGRVSRETSEELWTRFLQLRKSCDLFLVGTKDTEPLLLAAAGSGLVHFDPLDQADPKRWFPPPPEAPPPVPDVAVSPRVSSPGESASPAREPPPSLGLRPSWPLRSPAEPPPFSPAVSPSGGALPVVGTRDATLGQASLTPDAAARDSAPKAGPAAPSSVKGKQGNDAIGPQGPSPSVQTPPSRNRPGALGAPWLLAAIPAGALLATLALLRGWSKRRARRWRNDLLAETAGDEDVDSPPLSLVARYQGMEQDLGPLDLFPGAVHIGSGPDNTLRIEHPDVAARQARLFIRQGQLHIKNLARQSIEVDGKVLAKGKSCQLQLPDRITLAEGLLLDLDLFAPHPVLEAQDHPAQEPLPCPA